MHTRLNFEKTPFLVIWETTQACELACAHCRASAQPLRSPHELSTAEARNLLSRVSEMGTPIFVLSGGDPAERPDLLELITYGRSLGLRMGTIPAASSKLTQTFVQQLQQVGLHQMALSLDYPTAELHNQFRHIQGAYERTIQAAQWAHQAGLPLQINTTITAPSLPYLQAMAELVQELGAVFWEVFFLVPMGRGKMLGSLTPEQCEEAFEVLYRVNRASSFVVKITEGQHYRRFVCEREGGSELSPSMPERLRRSIGPGGSLGLAPQAVNSGKGFLFVSHTGDIFPSGFLPIRAGNVRTENIKDVYQTSEIFRQLRDPAALKGKCGICEYAKICGGSRSRAYALLDDPFESEPWCSYVPHSGHPQMQH